MQLENYLQNYKQSYRVLSNSQKISLIFVGATFAVHHQIYVKLCIYAMRTDHVVLKVSYVISKLLFMDFQKLTRSAKLVNQWRNIFQNFFEYLWVRLLYEYLILKISGKKLQYEILMKYLPKKNIIKSQWEFMFGSVFYA